MGKYYSSFIIFFMLFIQLNSFSQEKVSLDIGSDIVSRYVWRGTQYGGNSPSIQPYTSVTYSNFQFGFWGAYTVSDLLTNQELDTYISYSFLKDIFSATITDYYFPDNSDYNYFNYASNTTGHILEGTLSFNGSDNIPFTFLAAMNFFGADVAKIESKPTNTNFNKKIGIQYSNYFELGYSKSFESTDLNAFVGFTLSNPQQEDITNGFIGETGFYGYKAGIVNIGFSISKQLEIPQNYSLPVGVSLITNPETKKIYMVFKLTF